MEIKDLFAFKELETKCGNRYLAIKYLSDSARKLGKQYKEYHISESKLIQWALTGRCPYSENHMWRRLHANDDGLDEFLIWITDTEIADEVKRCYKQSVRNRCLTLCEDNYFSQSQLDRINVLLRMAWYST